MTYLIHEDNIERLEKQLKTIQKKCNKLGTEFHYNRGAEVFKEVTDEDTLQTYTTRFIEVEANGVARINGWEFVAVVEHMDGKGRNIVRQFNLNYTVPDRYYTVVPTCEHCNTRRTRKQTYLLVNESGEWKQVGGSCIKEFTNGLDADQLAAYISCFDKLIEGENFSWATSRTKYFNTDYILQLTVEVVRAFGYAGTNSTDATCVLVHELYNYLQGYPTSDKEKARFQQMIGTHNIDPDSDAAVDAASAIKEWVLNKADCSFGYMMNLRAVVNTEYVKNKHLGLLCSAVPTYNHEMDRIAKESARKTQMASEAAGSSYLGAKGERITVKVTSCRCITSWDSQYGTTYMYKFVDDQNRVLIWKTSSVIECNRVVGLTAKVKGHEEYQGVKQTLVYFCRVEIEEPKDPGPSAEDLEQNRKAMADINKALSMFDEEDLWDMINNATTHEEIENARLAVYKSPVDVDTCDVMIRTLAYKSRECYHEYSPSTPWNAPGMKVSDFIRVTA